MPKIAYIERKFNPGTLCIIDSANDILADYEGQGFRLTLRQLYYQFIARDIFPEDWIDVEYNAKLGLAPNTKNTIKNYKRLGGILVDARLTGLIDWDAIEDRTRGLQGVTLWDSPGEILRASASWYRIDIWQGQQFRPEVWIEKDALAGVIEPVCRELHVKFFPCKGYGSASSLWEAAQRLKGFIDGGQRPIIFHLGDHDPSGVDMTRDVTDRLSQFAEEQIEIRRLALSIEQVRKYKCPPAPVKPTDSRAIKYEEEHGSKCWELDALEPKVMVDVIRKEVLKIRNDMDNWHEMVEREKDEKAKLQTLSDNWTAVSEKLDAGEFE